ncbi:MAG: hypothetical protein VZR53_19815 [Prevotella sp.]|nr:hypothetical protein [Prevotella sp.]
MRLRHIILFLLMAVFITPIRAGGLINSLTISYDGNQLVKVTDAAEALN